VLSVLAFAGESVETVDDPDRISELAADTGQLLWLDLVDATERDLERLRQEFDLHHLAVEDVLRPGQRPKLEHYPTHAFIVAYVSDEDPTDLPELDLFIGPNWVVTVRKRNSAGRCLDLDPIRTRFDRTRDDSCGPGFLLYTILDEVVDGYFDLTDRMDEAIESLEDDIFEEFAPTKDHGTDGMAAEAPIQRKLLDLRKGLLHFRRRVIPLREVVLALLRREVPWVEESVTVYLQNVLDHLLRVADQIDAERELMGNAVDAHLATVSNRVNDIMKKMTSWGAILLISTLIAGIYGMNFKHMPELDSPLGYPLALGTMVLTTVGLYIYFRRKKWL
jgi:magnesium transporter